MRLKEIRQRNHVETQCFASSRKAKIVETDNYPSPRKSGIEKTDNYPSLQIHGTVLLSEKI